MSRKKMCKEPGCDNLATTVGYCRLDYLKNWREIRAEKKRKAAKNLDRYIDNILRNNPEYVTPSPEKGEGTYELTFDNFMSQDSVREVVINLGYREDLDTLIDTIKIDEDY